MSEQQDFDSTHCPDHLDGANVILWAWSGNKPFGIVADISSGEEDKIFGLAICKYEKEENFYRFSCNNIWEVIQDGVYNSEQEAIERLPNQYQNLKIVWKRK